MATVEPRQLKEGWRYRVKWRQKGLPERQVVPFTTEKRAQDFCDLVSMLGNVWPSEEQLRAMGFEAVWEWKHGSGAPKPEPLLPGRPYGPQVTFGEFAWYYLEEEVFASGKVNGKEIAQYRQRLIKHVLPHLGERPITEITPRELIRWQNALYVGNGGTLSAKTIANVRGTVVAPVFQAACREGLDGEPPLRATNPMLSVPLLRGPSREVDVIATPAEAAIMLDSLYASGNRTFADLTVTKFALNLRWGEVAGMPVRAVEHELKLCRIVQVLAEDEHRRWYVRRYPKTPQGFREAPFGEEIAGILTERCAGRDRDALIFPGPNGPFWIYKSYEYWWFKARDIARDAGLTRDLTPHGLRHSMLSVLARARIDGKSLQKQAGHKDFGFTYNKYIHQIQEAGDEIRAAAAPMLAGVAARRR